MTTPTTQDDRAFDPDLELRDLPLAMLADLADVDRRTRRVQFLMALAAAGRLAAMRAPNRT